MDVVGIVEKLHSLGVLRYNRRMNNYCSIYCPIHNDGNEHKPSCGVLITTEKRNGTVYPEGWVHCFSCGYVNSLKGLVEDILKNRHITSEAAKWIEENIPEINTKIDYDKLVDDTVAQSIISNFAINEIQTRMYSSQNYVSEEELASYRYTIPYMYERKLTDEIIEKFDVGFDANWVPPGRKKPVPCITFPVRDAEGRTLFCCRRSVEGKLYNYPNGVTKPVYGLDMIPADCKTVLICESIINALTLWTWGYVAVALMGTGNQYQLTQLKRLGVREFVLCMDGDDAGRKAANKLKNALKQVAIISEVDIPDGKDVNDLDKSDFEILYNDRG